MSACDIVALERLDPLQCHLVACKRVVACALVLFKLLDSCSNVCFIKQIQIFKRFGEWKLRLKHSTVFHGNFQMLFFSVTGKLVRIQNTPYTLVPRIRFICIESCCQLVCDTAWVWQVSILSAGIVRSQKKYLLIYSKYHDDIRNIYGNRKRGFITWL